MTFQLAANKLLKDLKNREFGYNDALVAQNRRTRFFESDIDLSTHVSRNIKLWIPIVGAAMDTVTEHQMAIALALEGGIGVVHYNWGPTDTPKQLEENIARQLAEVKLVKRYENGFVENPITLSPQHLVDDAARIRRERGISAIPITDNGKSNGGLVGLITKDDYSLKVHSGKKIQERMVKKIVTASWDDLRRHPSPLEEANRILLDSHKSVLPVVDRKGNLLYLVTRSDVEKSETYPHATKDSSGRLRVFAAVETRSEKAMLRMEALHKDVDGFVVDTAHAYFDPVFKLLKEAKRKYKDNDHIVGNISSPNAIREFVKARADGIRAGTGPGKGCQSWNLGPGREQLSAIYECAKAMHKYARSNGCYLNADGGIEYFGDIVKALTAGADTVTLGSMLGGTDEAPGEFENRGGITKKKYRGMGSAEAMKVGGSARYEGGRVPEGGVLYIESRGSVHKWVPTIIQGVKQGMFKSGCKSVEELHKYGQLQPAKVQEKREKSRFEG